MVTRRRLGLLIALILIGIGGCSRPEPPLRVGLLVWPPYELAILARHKGWLPEGDIRFVEYQSPSEMTRAFRNDLLDAVFLTTHISLRLAARGTDHRIIHVIDFSRGGDALVARKSIGELADLKGKTIGVEPSALGAYVSHRMLDFAGLEPSAVNMVPLDVAEQVEMWNQTGIDAVVSYEPVRTQLLRQDGHVLFDSRSIPNEIGDIIIAHTGSVHERGKSLQILVRGMTRALEYYRNFPVEASRLMAPRTSLSPETFRRALEGAYLVGPEENRRLLQGESPGLLKALDKQVEVMVKNNLLDHRADTRKLIDGRFVCTDCLN